MAEFLAKLLIFILQFAHFSFQAIDDVLFRVSLDDWSIFDILRSIRVA